MHKVGTATPNHMNKAVQMPRNGVNMLIFGALTIDAFEIFKIRFLCLPRAEGNQRFLFLKNESIKFCCSGGFSHTPNVLEASILFISTVFHVRSVSCRCLYPSFRASCAARVPRVTHSKLLILLMPLETNKDV